VQLRAVVVQQRLTTRAEQNVTMGGESSGFQPVRQQANP
jgi:hypothetical protein